LIDCAAGYKNEHEVGEAITESISNGVVKREDLFIVSKLFQNAHVWGEDQLRPNEALEKTLADLQTDYIDLYLMHWPFAFQQQVIDFPLRQPDGSPDPRLRWKMEYLRTWRLMERMVASGKVRAIGVSNFTQEQLAQLLENAHTIPAVNQIEVHPYLCNTALIERCHFLGIQVMAYCPLGSAWDRTPAAHGCTLLQHPVVHSVAAEHGKTVAQVLIRWGIQRGLISIPKSSKPTRMVENFGVRDWELTDTGMQQLSALDCDFRYVISYIPGMKWHDGVIETGTTHMSKV